jgi:hypothetical protein
LICDDEHIRKCRFGLDDRGGEYGIKKVPACSIDAESDNIISLFNDIND